MPADPASNSWNDGAKHKHWHCECASRELAAEPQTFRFANVVQHLGEKDAKSAPFGLFYRVVVGVVCSIGFCFSIGVENFFLFHNRKADCSLTG